MNLPASARLIAVVATSLVMISPVYAQDAPAGRSGQTVRVVGIVRDETNAIPLPGVPVEVLGTPQVVYTDVDGRYVLELPARRTSDQDSARGLSGEAAHRFNG